MPLADRRARAGFSGASPQPLHEIAAQDCGKPPPTKSDVPSRSSCFNEAAAYSRGKQRLRTSGWRPTTSSFNEAAAYSRGKRPSRSRHRRERLQPASMRPRHIAAENVSSAPPSPRPGTPGFNEAAAYSRGKPRVTSCGSPAPRTGFNEAAAYSRGKRGVRGSINGHPPRFNEAAAYSRGKRRRSSSPAGPSQGASMRPRHIAAENGRNGLPSPARALSLQ